MARALKILPFVCACTLSILASEAKAVYLLNGNFETVNAGNEPKQTFASWTELTSGGTTTASSDASARTGTGTLGGTSSLLMTQANGGAVVGQSPTTVLSSFNISLNFAVTATTNVDHRSFNMYLMGSTGSPQVNLRVRTDNTTAGFGDIQVYDGGGWVTIIQNQVLYSTDLNTPVSNSLTVSGTFAGSGSSSYVVTVNGTSSNVTSLFQGGTPTELGRVQFTSTNGNTQSYLVDNVVLVPEPSRALLMGGGLLGLLLVRRRRQASL